MTARFMGWASARVFAVVACGVCLAFLTSVAATANAAIITWQTPVNISGDGTADIKNDGTLLYAYAFGTTYGALTIDGVLFQDVPNATNPAHFFPTSSTMLQGGGIPAHPSTTAGSDYAKLFEQISYNLQLQGQPWTIDGLTVGTEYMVQFFVGDSRFGGSPALATRFGSPGGATVDANIFTGQYVVGAFIADATTQSISIVHTGSNSSVLNALQVRDLTPAPPVPEPSSMILSGLGALGLAVLLRRRRSR